MSSIEIDSNTIIKLLARRGSDLERKNIVLSEGEFGYAVDTKRLYIGDGVTAGGIPTSVKFHNTTTNITNIQETVNVNDLVYKSDTKEIYKLISGTGSSLSDWELIASPKYINTDNTTLSSTAAGSLFVKEISGVHISSQALGSGLSKSANKVIVSGDINVNTVTALTANVNKININTASSLTIPNVLTFTNNTQSAQYTFPLSGQSNNYYLTTNGNGALSWSPAAAADTSSGTPIVNLPVGTIIFYAVSSWADPDGWLICDGRSVLGTDYPELSAAIKNTYGGTATHFNLPNFLSGGMPFGAGARGASPIIHSNETLQSYAVTYPPNGQGAGVLVADGISYRNGAAGDYSYNAINIFGGADPGGELPELWSYSAARAIAGIWLIKHSSKGASYTARINVLSSGGLSAYNITAGSSTTSINSAGTYNLSIAPGDIGTGNLPVVAAYNRARSPQMYTYSDPGSAVYTVSDNIYRVKVTATGPGGVGYTRYQTGSDTFKWRANGTQGGAGSSIIAYINVEPGEKYVAYVGRAGTAIRTPDPLTETLGLTAGWGDDSGFSLSGIAGLTPLLSARGAYDPVRRDGATPYFSDWSANGIARGGIEGGKPVVFSHAKVSSYVLLTGGEGGQFMANGPSGPGAAGLYGSGPAPGGGGSGYARSDDRGQEVARAGNGLIIVEEL
jgi:hypothetical protein